MVARAGPARPSARTGMGEQCSMFFLTRTARILVALVDLGCNRECRCSTPAQFLGCNRVTLFFMVFLAKLLVVPSVFPKTPVRFLRWSTNGTANACQEFLSGMFATRKILHCHWCIMMHGRDTKAVTLPGFGESRPGC